MICSICGCKEYTKYGNRSDGLWTFKCSNNHKWVRTDLTINTPFPWREDDYHHPKNYTWDRRNNYIRIGE